MNSMPNAKKTDGNEFDDVFARCREIFVAKMKDYGMSWRTMRLPSLTDQIYIKAYRIRTLQTNEAKVNESEVDSCLGIINYSIMALIQKEVGVVNRFLDINNNAEDVICGLYDEYVRSALSLMEVKNHDYGYVWCDMRKESIVDIILTKIFRLKQIEDNKGHVMVSEGVESNYFDIINYAVFLYILIHEK